MLYTSNYKRFMVEYDFVYVIIFSKTTAASVDVMVKRLPTGEDVYFDLNNNKYDCRDIQPPQIFDELLEKLFIKKYYKNTTDYSYHIAEYTISLQKYNELINILKQEEN